MSPRAKVQVLGMCGALIAIALWLLLRLTLIGQATPGHFEFFIAFAVGYTIGGAGTAIMESRRNLRDQSQELEQLCQRMGFTLSTTEEVVDRSLFVEASLLRDYSTVHTRMKGRAGDLPFEMIDVSRWVQEHEGNDRFEWRHTLTILTLPHPLPPFTLLSNSGLVGLLGTLAGASGISLAGAAGSIEASVIAQFDRRYVIWPGVGINTAKHVDQGDVRSAEEKLAEVFTLEVLDFFIKNPGWNIKAADRQIALVQEDRIMPAAARLDFLERAAEVCRVLSQTRRSSHTAIFGAPAQPLDLRIVSRRMIAMFLCMVPGLWLGGAVGGAIALALVASRGSPSPWLFFPTFLVPAVMGSLLGAYVCYRYVFPRMKPRKGDDPVTREPM